MTPVANPAQVAADFKAYTNALGFVSNKPNGSTGNDLLYSCEAAVIRKQINAWTDADQAALEAAIVAHAQSEPGLYARPGWKQDEEQPDDYYGVAAFSRDDAKKVLQYAHRHCWYFKTSAAAKWYEPAFWRFPAFMCHEKWAAGEKPNYFLRLVWTASVAFSGSKTNQDPWMLNYLLVVTAGDKGLLERIATRMYFRRLTKTWGSLKNVFAAYFGDSNHPLAKYCPI
jgi:hypothetical protein